MPRPLPFTDDELRSAVLASSSLNEVARRLGLTVGGQTYSMLRQHLLRLGVDEPRRDPPGDTAPTRLRGARRRRSWTDDDLRDVTARSHSVAEVMRRLGYAPSGGIHRWLRAKMTMLDIDTTHFTGQAWARGESCPSGVKARPLDEILVQCSSYPSSTLRQRLIAAGLKQARCEICGIDSWRTQPISLALDHINGVPTDNRLENLRILCPNCHAQTDTWCRRNIRRAASG